MGNFSRDTFKINELKHYAGVRLKQGVPLVDADWNEMEDIRKFEFQDVLKWFVGNGVPKGNDGFHILPIPASDDFLIKGGDGTVMGAGRCLVDGHEVMINEDMNYKDQPLYENNDLAKKWGVDTLGPLEDPPGPETIRGDKVYLDVWEREVNAKEDGDLVNPAIGIETCVRIKQEWVVRVKKDVPAPPLGHVFYLLAVLVRHQRESAIDKIEDNRTTNVSLIDEIMDARGIKGNLGNRLDESLTKGGQLRHSVVGEDQLDTAVKGKLVTNGNKHEHISGDGATIKHSSLNKDDGTNPHGTTAVDVGALPVSDGKVQLGGGPGNAVATFIQSQTGTDIHAGLISGYGFDTMGLGGTRSALVGYSTKAEAYGVYARSSGTYSLYVRGTSFFSGAKTGYVVDIFVNRSGQRLRTGDVVKLKGTPVTRFQGDNNKIPVTEVTLADKENEKMIIGIVDCESIPEQGSPDNRVGPDDPTFIEDGSELFVVTLGAYAHCKVDATESPVEVGDLLTSSSNPGHAMKATDPKIGSIIGKALEPLKEGTGYISAFINIQ